MAYQSSLEDLEDEISSWGFTMSPSQFAASLEAEKRLPQARVGGRGRGITNPQHMANVRLAASIGDLKAHPFPMGHLPTTNDLLGSPAENEITPMLRQLGLNSRAEEIHSRTTRMNPKIREEIRVDGSLPVILNADLFKNARVDEDEGIETEVERFDPERPLTEQFSTIPELGKKGKKKKWRKLQGEELVPKAPERGRYEEVYSIGVHDGRATRQIYSADGLMTSIMSSSSVEDLEAELSEMGFSMSLSDFEKSLQSEESAQQLEAIRGEGITAKNYMSNIRLASELNELKIHNAPMGHLPTSTELLGTTHENEITPLLRKLGICGQDGELSSRKTRMVPQYKDEIKLDRNMPLILNGDLFDMSTYYDSDCSEEEEVEEDTDDPSLPLEQRFSTIKEFQEVSAQTQRKQQNNTAEESLSSYPESSEACTSSSNPDMSSHSTTADDASSSTGSSSSGTTYSAENQCSSEWHAEPPLLKKSKLYTPRELYDIKNGKHLRGYVEGNFWGFVGGFRKIYNLVYSF
ncbi:conserved hypothetical protein [Culex quinquefasciatus]|uniref:Uncharacterized protein n=1 Tax=Culex quinquefasciatus TaxID=7176 RepID=B0X857_CULQU|nr:conserved hypothetical protein [Culex quinquefasciatus]|eukprot:XP_001865829.1 conserved hypothetical protein [Culex quinquefasciatus]